PASTTSSSRIPARGATASVSPSGATSRPWPPSSSRRSSRPASSRRRPLRPAPPDSGHRDDADDAVLLGRAAAPAVAVAGRQVEVAVGAHDGLPEAAQSLRRIALEVDLVL